MLKLAGKSMAVALTLGMTSTVWAAAALPGSDPQVRALEQNRSQAEQQAEVYSTAADSKVQGEQTFMLSCFKFTGQDKIDTAVFAELTKDYMGRDITVSELQQAADLVTDYCRNQGYTVATAFLPQQDIKNGVVEIRILLGTKGEIKINNRSRLSEGQAERFLSGLKAGSIIKNGPLETVLNNLNDLPGIAAAGILSAGTEVGSSDLTVTLADKKQADTILYTDNHGGKYSGRYRYGFQTTFNEPVHIGDKLFLGGMLTNSDLHNYNLGYEMPLDSSGSRLGISYSLMDYSLSGFYNILDAVGRAKTFSIYGSTPFINTSRNYLAAAYGYDNRQLQDELRTFGSSTEKHSNALHLGIVGNSRGMGSYTGYSALYYTGRLTYDDINVGNEGTYHKFNTDINHIQSLGHTVNLHINLHSQLASKDLDGSEQFSLGGADGIRAYPQGEASGSSGYQATAELRYATPIANLSLATFIDWGEVELNKNIGDHRNLAGWGVGVQYARPNDYYLRVDYARKLNGEVYQSEENDKNGRVWFLAYKLF